MPELLRLPVSRTELVLDAIRRAILTRELLPGQPLVEAELAGQLGVSKTPVREALKVLSGSGLVTLHPYKGASVRVVDRELATSVYDVRLLLEPEAVGRAVDRVGRDGFAPAVAAFQAATAALAAADQAELSLCSRAFHRAIYTGCGNPLLVGMLDDLRDQIALISVAGWASSPTWTADWGEHQEILAAARAGHAADACDLTRRHITNVAARVVAATSLSPQ